MYEKIMHLVKKFFRKSHKSNQIDSNVIQISNNSKLLPNASFDFRFPRKTLSVTIDENSIIASNFIFETSDEGFVSIGKRCFINSGTSFISRSKIQIGDDVTIAWGCTFYDHNSHSIDWKERQNDVLTELDNLNNNRNILENKNWSSVKTRPIIIEDKVWIGFDCTILNGVTIGEGAIVGAKSVVRENVPPYTIVAGNPAKVIKKIKHE